LFYTFALEYVIRKFQANLEGLKLNVTLHLLVCADENLLGKNLHTIKKNTEALLVAGRELDVEVIAERTEYMFMPCEQNTG
jgi:hypothetical protein